MIKKQKQAQIKMLAEVGDMRRVLSQPYLAGLCNGHSSETIRIGQSDRRYIDVTRPEVHVLLRQNEQLNNTGSRLPRRRSPFQSWVKPGVALWVGKCTPASVNCGPGIDK